jgi:hypothetical protein
MCKPNVTGSGTFLGMTHRAQNKLVIIDWHDIYVYISQTSGIKGLQYIIEVNN